MEESSKRVSDDVMRQLTEAGVNETEAEANGKIMGAAMVNFAKREGLSPEAFYKRLGITFVRDEITGKVYLQTAYHGSGVKNIAKMRLNKIGTGEGSQVYGWGIYFAELREIAERYKEMLSKINPDDLAGKKFDGKTLLEWSDYWTEKAGQGKNLKSFYNARKTIAKGILTSGGNLNYAAKSLAFLNYDAEDIAQATEWAKETFKAELDKMSAGQVYNAEIPDSDVLLDYDKPFNQQPEKVKTALRELARNLTREQLADLDGNKNLLIGPNITGREIYNTLGVLSGTGSDKNASLTLNRYGIPGLQYLDEGSRGADEGTHNFVIWNEDAINIIESYYQDQTGKQGPRGAIDFSDPNRVKITLTPRADVTTSIHEMGHLFRWIMERQAEQFADDAQLQADWKEVRAFGDHEKFADGFIEYVKTGKAPNSTLRRVFEQFKQWLSDFYDAIRGNTGVELSDEMRGVFDRILAGDSTFEATYGMENSLRSTGNQVYLQESAKQDRKANPKLEPVKSKNPNLEVFRKVRDTSNSTRMMDHVNSPHIVAERHAKFKPFHDMAIDAYEIQERIRADNNRLVDKIYGKPGFFGRKGGLVPEPKHGDFNAILWAGDIVRKNFSNEELGEFGADAGMIKAYHMVRNYYNRNYKTLNKQRNKYGKGDINQIEGYVPHFFHTWRVMRNDMILTSYRSMSEAVKAAEKTLKENPGQKLQIVPALDDFGGQAKIDAVTLGDIQYFKLAHNVENTFALSAEDARALLDDVARMKNRSRVFKNAWHRKGSPGYDMDMEYAMRHYGNLTARYIAMDTLKHDGINLFERTFGRFGSEHKGLARYTKNYLNDVLGNPSTIEETLNNWIRDSLVGKYIPDYIGDRPATIAANTIASVTVHAKLGVLNVAASLMNLTQLNGTQAMIGFKYTGQGLAEYFHPTLATRRLYREAGIEENISMENPSGYSRVHNLRGAFAGSSMALFRNADGMVRKATFLGAYRKAVDEGKNRAAAIEYAKKVNNDVNFDYSVADAPDFIRRTGPIGTLLFQFKKYGIKQMELALPGAGKLKGKELARFWAAQLALSGLVGIPAFDLIKDLWKWIFDDDVELELKSLIGKSSLPAPVKRTVLYGALSNAGIDIGRRVGMGDFIPSELSDFAGPTAGTVYQLARALPKIVTEGNVIDTVEAISPGLANPIKAFITGETADKRRGRTKFKYETAGEKTARATGARPIRESVESDAVRLANYEQSKRSDEEIAAIDAFARVYNRQGTSEYKKALERLKKLRIEPARVKREIHTRRMGSEYERNLRTPKTLKGMERRKTLMEYGSMGR